MDRLVQLALDFFGLGPPADDPGAMAPPRRPVPSRLPRPRISRPRLPDADDLAPVALLAEADGTLPQHPRANREALHALIREAFASLDTQQVLARLDKAGIANATMNDMAGLWAHPQLKARQRWRTVGSPAGDIPALLPPGRSDRWEARMGAIPRIGEHTEALLREAGLDDAAIGALTRPAHAPLSELVA